MIQLWEQIEKDESIKSRYLCLKFLDTVDLAVGTTETIPIDLYSWVYWSEADFDIVKKSTGQKLQEWESDWETVEESSDPKTSENESVPE